MIFLLYAEPSAHVAPNDLRAIAKAARLNSAACSEAWGKAAPAVEVVDRVEGIADRRDVCPVVFTTEVDTAGALAVHFPSPVWFASARVFVGPDSGALSGSNSLAEGACHEILEAMADPLCNMWSQCGRSLLQARRVAVEICDPVQTHYTVGVGKMFGLGSIDVPVANFVTPAWFDESLLDERLCSTFLAGGGKFDYLGQLRRPFELGPDGYAIVEDDKGAVTDRWGSVKTLSATQLAAKRHPMARTWRRGCAI